MQIGILGFTDKRPILYPLMKLLHYVGDVIIITDDRRFRRLLEDYDLTGHLANIMIHVTDATPDEVWEEIDEDESDFDYIIYDLRDTLHEDIELYIHVKGSDYEDGEEDFLECVDDYIPFKLMYDGKVDNDKKTISLPITLKLLATLEVLENKKVLLPLPDAKINKNLAKLMAPKLNIKLNDALKLLRKGWQS